MCSIYDSSTRALEALFGPEHEFVALLAAKKRGKGVLFFLTMVSGKQ